MKTTKLTWNKILAAAIKRNGWRQLFFYLSNLDIWRFMEYPLVFKYATSGRKLGKTLDLGAGYSVFPAFFPNEDYTVIDLGKGACKYQQAHGVKAIVHDMTTLPFENGTMDTIIAISSIEHVPNDIKVFAEIARVLKKDGDAIVTLPHTNGITEVRKLKYPAWMEKLLNSHPLLWRKILGETQLQYFTEQTETDSIIKYYSLIDIKQLLSNVGLEIVEQALIGKQTTRGLFKRIPPGWFVLKDVFIGLPFHRLERLFLARNTNANGIVLLARKQRDLNPEHGVYK